MEQVLQGLQIAQGVYGLNNSYEQGQRADQQLELSKKGDARAEEADLRAAEEATRRAATEDRKQQGIILPQEAAELSKAFIMSKAQPKNSTNSIAMTIQGEEEPTWFTPKTQNLPRRTRMAENIVLPGETTPVNALIDEDTGRVIQKYIRGEKELSPAALEAKQRSFNASVEKYSEKTEPLNRIFNAVGSVEKELGFNLDDYDPRTDTVVDRKAGAIANTPDLPGTSLPLIGRVSFYNKDARTLQSTMAKVFNVELKDRSGAAVTSNELERLRDEFETGKFNTEADMLAALKRYKAAASDLLNSVEAPYRGIVDIEGKNVVDRLDQYGGFTSRRFAPQAAGAPTAPPAQAAPSIDQMSLEDLLREEARRRGRR
jgi:hypothetical protein